MRTLLIATLLALGVAMITAATLFLPDKAHNQAMISSAEAAQPLPETRACRSKLTGREVEVPPSLSSFGGSQHQAHFPLGPNEYLITIDDGPNGATTPRLLQILAERCVHATFMLVGYKAEAAPELVRRIIAAGNSVGSHSYSHRNFSQISEAERMKDILKGVEAVDRVAGFAEKKGGRHLFRMPGATGVPNVPSPEWLAELKQQNLVFSGWEWAADDFSNAPADVSYDKFFPRMGDRGVILLHDGPIHTIELLPMVLDELERRGGRIVTLRQIQ